MISHLNPMNSPLFFWGSNRESQFPENPGEDRPGDCQEDLPGWLSLGMMMIDHYISLCIIMYHDDDDDDISSSWWWLMVDGWWLLSLLLLVCSTIVIIIYDDDDDGGDDDLLYFADNPFSHAKSQTLFIINLLGSITLFFSGFRMI